MAGVWKEFGTGRIAEMGSSGPWYSPVVKANAIAAYRAVRDHQMRWSDAKAQIEVQMPQLLRGVGNAPDLKTVRNWATTTPDFPREALADGRVRPAQIMPSVRRYLNESNRKAPMGLLREGERQREVKPRRFSDGQECISATGIVKTVGAIAGLYVVGRGLEMLLTGTGNPSSSSQRSTSRRRSLLRSRRRTIQPT